MQPPPLLDCSKLLSFSAVGDPPTPAPTAKATVPTPPSPQEHLRPNTPDYQAPAPPTTPILGHKNHLPRSSADTAQDLRSTTPQGFPADAPPFSVSRRYLRNLKCKDAAASSVYASDDRPPPWKGMRDMYDWFEANAGGFEAGKEVVEDHAFWETKEENGEECFEGEEEDEKGEESDPLFSGIGDAEESDHFSWEMEDGDGQVSEAGMAEKEERGKEGEEGRV